jgi:hypothetical protein
MCLICIPTQVVCFTHNKPTFVLAKVLVSMDLKSKWIFGSYSPIIESKFSGSRKETLTKMRSKIWGGINSTGTRLCTACCSADKSSPKRISNLSKVNSRCLTKSVMVRILLLHSYLLHTSWNEACVVCANLRISEDNLATNYGQTSPSHCNPCNIALYR